MNSDEKTLSGFAARLRDFIRGKAEGLQTQSASSVIENEAKFNSLALELFALQYASNPCYRRLCEARGAMPEKVSHWTDIPAVPTSAFKELDMTSLAPRERAAVFHSSGTTGQIPSRHFHSKESLEVYEASLLAWFGTHLMPVDSSAPSSFLLLTPPPALAPRSSLVHMLETVCCRAGAPSSAFVGRVDGEGGWMLDHAAALKSLSEANSEGLPLMVMGTAFSFVHLLDHLAAINLKLSLPEGSRVMETGGYKGRSRSLSRADLHALITKQLGIPASQIVCEYGMSELSSQAYDKAAGAAWESAGVFRFPPWARARVVSPETGREVADGETGLTVINDLANVFSVMAVQTEDLARRRGGGFELIGRAALAESRGCSLMPAA